MASLLETLGQHRSTSLSPAGGSGATYSAAPQPNRGNPFSSMFASDAGGLAGFLGQLSGSPTGGEMVQARMGAGQQQGMEALQRRISEGMDPQSAVVDFVSSEEGQAFFSTSQDPIGAIKGYLQVSQSAAPDPYTLGPGEARYSGSNEEVAANPTTDSQNNQSLLDLAKATPEQAREFGKAMMGKASADPNNLTQKEDAMGWLISKGMVSEDFAKKSLSGLIQTVPTRDAAGNTTGMVVVDLSKFAQTMNPADLQTVVVGSDNGGMNGDGNAGSIPAQPDGSAPKVPGSIIFGAGPVAGFAAGAGGILGNFDPNLAAPEYTKARTALSTIFLDVTNLLNINKTLAAELKQMSAMADRSGIFSNPLEQGTALMNLHDVVDRRMAANYADLTSSDPTITNERRGKASEEIAALRKLQGDMPSRDELYTAMQAAQQGEGGIVKGIQEGASHIGEAVKGVGDAVKATGEAATSVPTTEGENVPLEFKTEQEAAAAAKAGTLKPGTRIKVGGKSGVWK